MPVILVVPVPPLDTFNVPDNVTAPEVAVLGVNPVVPALNVVTDVPAPGVCHVGTPATTVKT